MTINQITNHWAFSTARFVFDLVVGAVAGKQVSGIIEKYVSNLYLKRFVPKLVELEGSSTLRKFFMSSVPKFVEKYNIFGKAGSAVVNGIIGYAIDSIISTIVGAIAKSSLQNMTK